MLAAPSKVDLDFSLSMHNRTGKYFIGKDILSIADLPIGKVYYWLFPRDDPPGRFASKLIGRFQWWQVKARTAGHLGTYLPARNPMRPLLHLDPFTVPTTRLRRCDIVLCHDVGPVTHPILFEKEVATIYRGIYAEITRIGPHMVFVSQASRDEFSRLYPATQCSSSRVIYPAIRANVEEGPVQPVAQVSTPFLLTVGSIGDRKNQARCIAAYARSGLWGEGISYVLCGAREPGHERVAALAAETPGVVLLDYVSDAELNWLYGTAKGFVLASLLEGFGMPVSEAIARGQVPLISRDSVLHEVAGEAAIPVDPLDEDEIAAGMRRLAGMDDAERSSRLATMRRSNERFSLAAFQRDWRAAFADYATWQPADPA